MIGGQAEIHKKPGNGLVEGEEIRVQDGTGEGHGYRVEKTCAKKLESELL